MKTASDHLRDRMDPSWPAPARKISETALAAFESFADRRSRLNPDKADFVDKVREAAAPSGKQIAAAMQALEGSRAKLANDRAALRAKAFATPSTHGAEIRAYLRDLPKGEVPALLLGANADREAQRAVLEAVPLLTPGLSADLRQRVETEFFAVVYSDETAALAATEAALDHAATSIQLAAAGIERDGQFLHSGEFQKWLATECKPDKAADDAAAARAAADAERMAAIDARLAALAAA